MLFFVLFVMLFRRRFFVMLFRRRLFVVLFRRRPLVVMLFWLAGAFVTSFLEHDVIV